MQVRDPPWLLNQSRWHQKWQASRWHPTGMLFFLIIMLRFFLLRFSLFDILIWATLELFRLKIQPTHSCLPYLRMITLLLQRTLLRSKGLIIKRNGDIWNRCCDIVLENAQITIAGNLVKYNWVVILSEIRNLNHDQKIFLKSDFPKIYAGQIIRIGSAVIKNTFFQLKANRSLANTFMGRIPPPLGIPYTQMNSTR